MRNFIISRIILKIIAIKYFESETASKIQNSISNVNMYLVGLFSMLKFFLVHS